MGLLDGYNSQMRLLLGALKPSHSQKPEDIVIKDITVLLGADNLNT